MSNERTGVLELTLGDSYIGSAYSPQVEVTDTDTGHEVAITYMSPEGIVTERFDVADGEQGPQGPAGFSPTVTITDTPTGHTVTITDAQGPHSYFVPNYAQEEQQRQDAWDTLSGEVTDAITAAESATGAASTAAQSATSAATSANTAAQAATTAAASATTAASSANAAATAANSAATAAGTAADAATTAAGDATDAASAANTAAEAAQAAATEVAPEVAWLWGNQLTGELTGDILTAADAYAAPPMALTVDGRSTQASTTGKNLLDPSTLSNGYITSSGGVTGSTDTYKHTDYMPVTAGETYRVSQGGTTFSAIYTAFYDESKGFLSAKTQNSYTAPTYLAPEGAAYMRSSFNGPQAGYAMVEVNSGSWGGYEPYTGGKPSPSPDYSQPIESVDELALVFAGKNLLPNARTGRSSYNPAAGTTFNPTSGTPSGTITDNGDGTFTMTAPSEWAGATLYTEPLPSGTYHIKAAFSGSSPRVSIGTVRARDMTFVGTPTNFTSSDSIDKTYTFGEPHIITVYVGSSSAGTVTITQPQIELGSTATSYEPYEGHTVPIPLQSHVLRSLPDGTKDTLALTYLRPSTREGWAWYSRELVTRVGETTTAATDGVTGTVGVDVMSTTGEIADGSTVLYKLATPVTTQLDPIELPVLPASTCTAWSDPTTGLTMEYVRDSNLVVQSLSAETAIAYASIAAIDGPTATASHAVGTYLTMSGTLYKVTQAIAVGETIAAGTNVNATTVMAELIARTA